MSDKIQNVAKFGMWFALRLYESMIVIMSDITGHKSVLKTTMKPMLLVVV